MIILNLVKLNGAGSKQCALQIIQEVLRVFNANT
jgi:hypothetical protein